jgi:hypothetical protein
MGLLTFGARAAINAKYRPQPAAAPPSTLAAGNMSGLLLLGLGGVLLYTLVK